MRISSAHKYLVARSPSVNGPGQIFNVVAFQTFSCFETWGLKKELGRPPVINDLASGQFERALVNVRNLDGKLYTGAFILCANKAFGFAEKHMNHIALFKWMFLETGFDKSILNATSLKSVAEELSACPLYGAFMSYQIAIDLNYSPIINFDENDFTRAGPGAVRGIHKTFSDTGGYSSEEIIMQMVHNQQKEFERRGIRFEGLAGRPLHAIDCQNLFCELDKYCRVAFPGVQSSRKRIKSKFRSKGALPDLFLPPK